MKLAVAYILMWSHLSATHWYHWHPGHEISVSKYQPHWYHIKLHVQYAHAAQLYVKIDVDV